MKQHTNNTISFSIGVLLAGFVAYSFCVQTLLFFVGVSISKASVWAIYCSYFLLGYFYLVKANDLTHKSATRSVLATIACIATSLLISSYFIDYSWDGQGYHGEAMLQLSNGWNPTNFFLNNDSPDLFNAVINHFPKAAWVSGAMLYKITGVFECTKATNLILIIACGCIVYPLIRKHMQTKLAVVVSLLVAFNPICLNMYLSNMIDGHIANYTYIFFALCVYVFYDKQKFLLPILLLVIFYLCNTKFTAVGYVGVYLIGLAAILFLYKKGKENFVTLLTIFAAAAIALAVFGYNVYVKNYTHYKHPFHPFKGSNPVASKYIVDAMDYRTGNTVVNFLKSNFASSTYAQCYNNHLTYKLPFTFSKYEIERFAFAGVMIGGYGVLFSGVLITSLLLLLHLIIKLKAELFTKYGIYLWTMFIIMASILINPYGYIARYTPQYYLIPIIIFLLWAKVYPSKKIMQNIFVGIVALNSFLICGYTYYNFVVTKTVKQQLVNIKNSNKNLIVNFGSCTAKRELFRANNIQYKVANKFDSLAKTDTIFRSEVAFVLEK